VGSAPPSRSRDRTATYQLHRLRRVGTIQSGRRACQACAWSFEVRYS
jgi:hypothetical protein